MQSVTLRIGANGTIDAVLYVPILLREHRHSRFVLRRGEEKKEQLSLHLRVRVGVILIDPCTHTLQLPGTLETGMLTKIFL